MGESMIFYTLCGPRYKLEIHDDKIKLLRRWPTFSKKTPLLNWDIDTLSQFEMTIPQYIVWGKLEWTSFDGKKGSFRFSTDANMVRKIEKYIQKKIMKNHQRHNEHKVA